MARARLPGIGLGPVGPVRLAPQGSLPVARLPQELVPGNRAVVSARERHQQVIAAKALGLVRGGSGIVDLHRRDVFAHRIVDAADKAALVSNSYGARQKALRDAVGPVDAPRRAPSRDQIALANDDRGRTCE